MPHSPRYMSPLQTHVGAYHSGSVSIVHSGGYCYWHLNGPLFAVWQDSSGLGDLEDATVSMSITLLYRLPQARIHCNLVFCCLAVKIPRPGFVACWLLGELRKFRRRGAGCGGRGGGDIPKSNCLYGKYGNFSVFVSCPEPQILRLLSGQEGKGACWHWRRCPTNLN